MMEKIQLLSEEPIKPSSENTPTPLERFRQEIAELKRKEDAGESPTAHFSAVQVDELTEEDMSIWENYKIWETSGTMSPADMEKFLQYKKSFKIGAADKSKSSGEFVAFLSNKVAIITGRMELIARYGKDFMGKN